MKQKFIVFLILITVWFGSRAQEFGGNPPSLKWRQINTDTARIIFPAGMQEQAQRVASVVHSLAQTNPLALGADLHKINIVLQNQTTIANAYVGLVPYRSEFFLTPFLNNFKLGSLPWDQSLAIHEYRHVQQFNNFRNGASKAMYYLFGEGGLALAIFAAIPDWFYEGDAIYHETVLTQQGRGRLPNFINEFPALWNAHKNYSWMKLRNGSLKHYVPDHYSLGYLLVNYGRLKYGDDFWTKVTRDASAFKGIFYPFQTAVKKHSGLNYKSFYQQAFDYYKKNLPVPEQNNSDAISSINPSSKFVTNYLFPFRINKDSLLYLKKSYREIAAFYINDKNGEHRLRVKDISLYDQFSYRNGKIVYAAYEPDSRWGWKDFGVIKVLDIQSGLQQTITHRTKYFSPDISEDGTRIVALQINPDGKNELHLLDAANGAVLKKITSEQNYLFTDPKFMDAENLVSAIRLPNGQMALGKIAIETGEVEWLTPPSFNVLGFPDVQQGNIYFSASYSGNDELYMYRMKDKKVFQLTESALGNYYVSAFEDRIVWSAFTADGFRLMEKEVKDVQFSELNPLALQEMVNRIPMNVSGFKDDVLQQKTPAKNYPVSNYKKGYRLFNFHSWWPYYEDPEFTFTLYGENVLNTLQTELYYRYNQNEQTNAAGMNIIYGALFPYLRAGAEYTFNRTAISNNDTLNWDELDARAGFNIPLNFTRGRSFNFFNAGTNFVNRQLFYKGPQQNINFNYLHHYISWFQQVQRARQHIFPRWGYALSFSQRHAISEFTGYQIIGNGTVYLPGLVKNHNLVVTGSFQQRDTLRLLFSNRFANSRGYNEYYFSRMWKLSGNYYFPVLLPDWGFGNLVYFERIRANAFYDFTKVYSRNKKITRDLRSVGGEIFVDTKWWNQQPVTFGFRFSHLLNNEPAGPTQRNVFEFILPVNLIPN